MDAESFELMLIAGMADDIRSRVLKARGLSEDEAAGVRSRCSLALPKPGPTFIREFEGILGPAVRRRACMNLKAPFVGSVENSFILPSFVHLFWVVYEASDGTTWGHSFQNQYLAPMKDVSGGSFRPELVTHGLLAQVASDREFCDGWDERLTEQYVFRDGRYEGEFVWGLLQTWRRIESAVPRS